VVASSLVSEVLDFTNDDMQQHGSLCDETIEEECNIAEETILQIEDSFLASKLPTAIIKFDTACSGNMSGIKGRITINSKLNEKIKIKGFNALAK
jgi:hypothetical protein